MDKSLETSSETFYTKKAIKKLGAKPISRYGTDFLAGCDNVRSLYTITQMKFPAKALDGCLRYKDLVGVS